MQVTWVWHYILVPRWHWTDWITPLLCTVTRPPGYIFREGSFSIWHRYANLVTTGIYDVGTFSFSWCFDKFNRLIVQNSALSSHCVFRQHCHCCCIKKLCHFYCIFSYVEHISSAVECRTRNRESPGSNLLWCRLEVWAFSFSPRCPGSRSCINEYLAIDGGENVKRFLLKLLWHSIGIDSWF